MNTYNIITIGCQMNKSDGERLALYLEDNGLKEAKNRGLADLVVLTTCGVRESAENRIFGLIPQIRKENRGVKIVLTGCLSEREDIKKRIKNGVDLWMPIGDFHMLDKFIKTGVDKKTNHNNYLSYIAKHSSKFSAFVPIGNGCDNYCAYCVVPYARGREVYRSAEEILDEVRGLVKKGYKEFNLIAQNVNSYNANLRINANQQIANNSNRTVSFSELLKMVNEIPGYFWIRFASSHPKDMSDELIKTITECDKVCKHIHLPVQAGDNTVLKRMNRGYTVGDYKELVKKIRHVLNPPRPDVTSGHPSPSYAKASDGEQEGIITVAISTDIIVGFPGETKEQFNNTLKLFEEVKFDMAYIAQYSPRPGTAAAKMPDDVSKEEKKRRDLVLTEILKKTAFENNKKYIGKTVEILVDGKNRKGEYRGKTRSNKNVSVEARGRSPQNNDLTGRFIKVKIEKVGDFGMRGVLDVSLAKPPMGKPKG